MTLREATAEDVPEVLDLHEAAVRAHGPAAYDDEQVAAWADRGDATGPPLDDLDRYVVFERAGDVVAFGDLDRSSGEICGLYVHPDDVRTGVGSAVLDHLESHARDAGLEETDLLASMNTVGFYERRGYDRVETVTHETTGGVELDCVRMSKALPDEPL